MMISEYDARISNRIKRFWSCVFEQPDDGCWVWTGTISQGYGRFRWREGGKMRSIAAHRYVWEQIRGEIPDGLQLDHLCRNRACVNPDHLEVVTCKENILRGMSPGVILHRNGVCKNGHPLTSDNMYKQSRGWGCCKICKKANVKRWQASHREHRNKRDRDRRANVKS